MPQLSFLRAAWCAVIITVSACASGGAPGVTQSGSQGAQQTAQPHDRTQISAAEMQGIAANNLYEVVQRLHPEWLVKRAAPTTGRQKGLSQSTDSDITVYVGEQRAGNTEFLKTMVVGAASTLKFYSSGDAQAKFGTGNLNGVIQVLNTR
jgi:hypothetical protein